MSVKRTVFGSNSERDNFYKLSRTWGEQYRIHANLPVLMVFDLGDLKLTDQEIAWCKKTSIDYTLCGEDDRPILCIEFDGMQQGFNVGTSYNPNSPYRDYLAPNEWRQKITELKLKVAFASGFPFFVVSSAEFQDLSPEIRLTIVDGVIGVVLANQSARERLAQFDPNEIGWTNEEFDALQPLEKDELIADWAISTEVEAELEHNPIDRLRWSMHQVTGGIKGHSIKYLSDPDIDAVAPLPPVLSVRDINSEMWQARIEAFNAQRRIGAEITLHTADCGDIVAVAWIPNFKSVGFSGETLVEDIAYILAVEKLRKRRHTG